MYIGITVYIYICIYIYHKYLLVSEVSCKRRIQEDLLDLYRKIVLKKSSKRYIVRICIMIPFCITPDQTQFPTSKMHLR